MAHMNDIQKYFIEEFIEDFQAQRMGRRELVRRAVLTMGGVATAAAALRQSTRALAAAPAYVSIAGARPGNMSEPEQQQGRTAGTLPPAERTTDHVVSPDDPAISAAMVSFPGPVGTVRGYLARPAAAGSYPAVVVIHENRGLYEPNMDIARRFAKLGFVALAVDLLSRAGGTEQFASDPQAAGGALGQLGGDAPAADALAAVTYLKAHPSVNGNIGATGYCFGGGVVWRMGMRGGADLKAIVPHYGPPPPVDEVPNLRAAALGVYAELDTRINSQSESLAEALRAAGKTWEFWTAPAANHAFFNNTGQSYNPEGAREAWQRTIAWFDRFLVTTPRSLPATGDGSLEG